MAKIVIVEDMPLYATPLREALETRGHVVLVLRGDDSLEDTVGKIDRFVPNAVLLDHDLGASYTGAEVAAKIAGYKKISISSTNPGSYAWWFFWMNKGQLLRPASCEKLVDRICHEID